MPELATIHLDAMPSNQRQAWSSLSPLSELGFVLYGGTALAVRFNHRISVDFDFFSSEKYSKDDLYKLLPWLKSCDITQDQPEQSAFSFITSYGAHLTFLGGFENGRLDDPDYDPSTNIQIASPKDIFALKLGAIHGRVESKDYKDIAELLRQGFKLEDAIAGANCLISGMPDTQFTLRTLCFFDDIDISAQDKEILVKSCGRIGPIPKISIINSKLYCTDHNPIDRDNTSQDDHCIEQTSEEDSEGLFSFRP